MAGSINKVILVGNLGADPKVSNTANGAKIVNLSIATTDSWKDKLSGEKKERTEWHRVVIFNPQLADIADRYLKKGSKVYLEGQLQTRKWEDNNGQERYSTEVVLQNFSGNLVLLDARGDGVPAGGVPEFAPSGELLSMTVADWAALTEERYRRLFRGSAVKRAKYEGLMRNIRAALSARGGRGNQ